MTSLLNLILCLFSIYMVRAYWIASWGKREDVQAILAHSPPLLNPTNLCYLNTSVLFNRLRGEMKYYTSYQSEAWRTRSC